MLSLSFSPFPQLQTERLLLKQIQEKDASALFVLRSNTDVVRYLDRAPAASVEDTIAFIGVLTNFLQKDEGITWGIFLKTDPGVLCGTIGFWQIQKEHYRAEIGYMLLPSKQGKGFMHEAIQTVLQYGFESMKLHSVEANVNPENKASIKVLERNGFVREAYFKENHYYNGKFSDSAIYSLLTPLQRR